MKKISLSLVLLATGAAFAQATCETLVDGIQTDLAQVTSVERVMSVKTGFIEMAYDHQKVSRAASGELTQEVLEHRGMALPGRAAATFGEAWLGPAFDFSCEGAELEAEDKGFNLTLQDSREDTPIEVYTLEIRETEGQYQVQTMRTQIPGPLGMVDMKVTYQNWTYQ